MDSDVPKCPRCPGGGQVNRIAEESRPSELSPHPAYIRTSEVFQCTCGWTMVRTKAPERKTERMKA